MAILSASDARVILNKALALSKADACQLTLSGALRGNLRFARNAVSTSGGSDTLSLAILSRFGRKSGAVTINEFDDASIARGFRQSEELARLAPEDPEAVDLLGPQTYLAPPAYVEKTARIDQDFRASAAAASLEICKRNRLTGAGYYADSTTFSAIANSRGLAGYHRRTDVNFNVTTRTEDGLGSGYGIADFNDVSRLDTSAITEFAAQKAVRSREARAIEPGKYTVLLEPAAGVDLLNLMVNAMDARGADEGRSFLSKSGGATRVGEKIVDERVNISADPMNAALPGSAWSSDGRPLGPVKWIEDGIVRTVFSSRYWAKKKGLGDGIPPGRGLIMAGGDSSLADLIKTVKRGVLVTRLWYIRAVDPQTLLYTGLTRDGTFFIENGEVKYPVKNFRFNESPVIMLNNVESLGRPQRVEGSLVPPMVLRDFTFSSLSDAV